MAGITDFIRELVRPMCDINHDGKLEENVEKDGTTFDEVSIFNRACESYNEKEQTIEVFEDGNWIKHNISKLIESVKATNKEFIEKLEEMYGKYVAPKINKIPQFSAEQAEKIEKEINDKLIQKPDATSVAKTSSLPIMRANAKNKTNNVTTHIDKVVFGQKVSFSFNQAAIEDYIINDLVDHHGRKITYYNKISEIRAKDPTLMTESEKKLLKEFEDMVKWVIDSAVEYGVDPKKIIAIIQEENGGKGINEDAYGKIRNKMPEKTFNNGNGNGYMAITSINVTDFLGGRRTNTKLGRKGDVYHDDKKLGKPLKQYITERYGSEMVTLLESKGYNLDCTTAKEKKELSDKIWDKINSNNDPEFNIRMGTLILRYKDKQTGNKFSRTAYNYNGSRNAGEYSRRVSSSYNKLTQKEAKYT